MKRILKILILSAGLVLYLNVNSFANVDISAYGGYVFKGNLDLVTELVLTSLNLVKNFLERRCLDSVEELNMILIQI